MTKCRSFVFFEEMVEGTNKLIALSAQFTPHKRQSRVMFKSEPVKYVPILTKDYFSQGITNKLDLIGSSLTFAIISAYFTILINTIIVIFLDVDPILQYIIALNKQFPVLDQLLATSLEKLGCNIFLKIVFFIIRAIVKDLIWFETLRHDLGNTVYLRVDTK